MPSYFQHLCKNQTKARVNRNGILREYPCPPDDPLVVCRWDFWSFYRCHSFLLSRRRLQMRCSRELYMCRKNMQGTAQPKHNFVRKCKFSIKFIFWMRSGDSIYFCFLGADCKCDSQVVCVGAERICLGQPNQSIILFENANFLSNLDSGWGAELRWNLQACARPDQETPAQLTSIAHPHARALAYSPHACSRACARFSFQQCKRLPGYNAAQNVVPRLVSSILTTKSQYHTSSPKFLQQYPFSILSTKSQFRTSSPKSSRASIFWPC